MAEYENVKCNTFPVGHDGLILVTLDPEGFHEVIIKEIIENKDMINWNPLLSKSKITLFLQFV